LTYVFIIKEKSPTQLSIELLIKVIGWTSEYQQCG